MQISWRRSFLGLFGDPLFSLQQIAAAKRLSAQFLRLIPTVRQITDPGVLTNPANIGIYGFQNALARIVKFTGICQKNIIEFGYRFGDIAINIFNDNRNNAFV